MLPEYDAPLPFATLPLTLTAQEFLSELQKYPERHQHSSEEEILKCSQQVKLTLNPNPWQELLAPLDLQGKRLWKSQVESVVQAHHRIMGMAKNGGVRCDVVTGPCACGAWH